MKNLIFDSDYNIASSFENFQENKVWKTLVLNILLWKKQPLKYRFFQTLAHIRLVSKKRSARLGSVNVQLGSAWLVKIQFGYNTTQKIPKESKSFQKNQKFQKDWEISKRM